MAKRRDKPSLILPVGYLSPSQITSYLRCAKAYEFRYVEKKILPPALAMVEGTAHHKAYETNNRHKIKHGKDLKPDTVYEAFADKFSDEKKAVVDWEGETEKDILSRGKRAIQRYMERIAPGLKPISAEEKLNCEIAGVPLVMIIDVMEKISGKTGVLDYKVVGRAKSQKDADKDLQLGIYGTVKAVPFVSFLCVVKSSLPSLVRVTSKMSEQRVSGVKMTVLSVADAITRGSFPLCDPTIVYTCSAERCGYWRLCRGKKSKS